MSNYHPKNTTITETDLPEVLAALRLAASVHGAIDSSAAMVKHYSDVYARLSSIAPGNPARTRRLAVAALTAAKDDARYITWYTTWADVSDIGIGSHEVRNALSNAFVKARQIAAVDVADEGYYVGDYNVDKFIDALEREGFYL